MLCFFHFCTLKRESEFLLKIEKIVSQIYSFVTFLWLNCKKALYIVVYFNLFEITPTYCNEKFSVFSLILTPLPALFLIDNTASLIYNMKRSIARPNQNMPQ